jgi:hypothetical protein
MWFYFPFLNFLGMKRPRREIPLNNATRTLPNIDPVTRIFVANTFFSQVLRVVKMARKVLRLLTEKKKIVMKTW